MPGVRGDADDDDDAEYSKESGGLFRHLYHAVIGIFEAGYPS